MVASVTIKALIRVIATKNPLMQPIPIPITVIKIIVSGKPSVGSMAANSRVASGNIELTLKSNSPPMIAIVMAQATMPYTAICVINPVRVE
jgi:hypothetical protein